MFLDRNSKPEDMVTVKLGHEFYLLLFGVCVLAALILTALTKDSFFQNFFFCSLGSAAQALYRVWTINKMLEANA
jgi:hypothetical protein